MMLGGMEIPGRSINLYREYGKSETGIDWLKKSADNGFPRALREYALLLALGTGVDRDEDLAFRLMRQSASKNYAPAQFDMAQMLHSGTGTVRNPSQVTFWLEKAIEQGYLPAEKAMR